MTPILTDGAPPLREAFYALSMAQRMPDAELLDDVVRRYPIYAYELTEFAIELALDSLRGDAAADTAEAALNPAQVSPAVSRAMSRFHNRLHAVRTGAAAREPARPVEAPSNPFAALSRDEFRGFARRLGANSVLVAKLRDRQIAPDTMSDGFRRRVANELKAPLEVVVAHFAMSGGATMVTRQFFKADAKPDHASQQSFEEAVRSSGLTDEQQRHLLSL
jgi:hypothetical protein